MHLGVKSDLRITNYYDAFIHGNQQYFCYGIFRYRFGHVKEGLMTKNGEKQVIDWKTWDEMLEKAHTQDEYTTVIMALPQYPRPERRSSSITEHRMASKQDST